MTSLEVSAIRQFPGGRPGMDRRFCSGPTAAWAEQPFVARYAFIAVPVGNTLDLNAIHNQVSDETTVATS